MSQDKGMQVPADKIWEILEQERHWFWSGPVQVAQDEWHFIHEVGNLETAMAAA